tara:strand:+ start:926 stop:1486 length:561 start_codon:yes stop_codon:yes gene_type:complete
MTTKSDYYPPKINSVPITANDLSAVGVPPRFWSPKVNPFLDYPGPLSWWEGRYTYARDGVGFLALSASNSFVELSALVELLKRLLSDGDRPFLSGSLSSSCLCLRSSDIVRGKHDWDELTSVGYLLVSGIGVGFTDRVEGMLSDLFRARYEAGAVTFYHVVERMGDKEFLGRIVNLIPEGAYITSP